MFAAQAWWEEAGQAGLTMKGFNGAVYSYLMKNRFRGEYGDKTEVEHSGKVQTDEPEMTDLELARRIAFVFGEAMQMKQQQDQDQQSSQLQRLAAPLR
jgi:hypothetical protein